MFIWEYLYFSLIFKGSFFTRYSILFPLALLYIILFLYGMQGFSEKPYEVCLYIMNCFLFSPAVFNILPLSLTFDKLIVMCRYVDFFGFLLLGIFWASSVRVSINFYRFRKFWVMLSLNKLSILFLLSLLISGTLYNVFLCFFMCFLTLRFVFLKNQSLVTVFTD